MNKKLTLSAAALLCSFLTSCAGSDSSSAADTTTTATTTTVTTTSAITTTPKPAEPARTFDPNAAETVITLTDPDTGDWVNPMGEDFLDANSFPADTPLTFTVEIALTDKTAESKDKAHQIAFAPCYSDSWEKIGAEPQMIYGDFPVGADMLQKPNFNDGVYCLLKDGDKFSEDVYRLSDNSLMAELFVKPDGFIKFSPEVWTEWNAGEVHTVTFTVSLEAVNRMRDESSGMLLQCSGGFEVRKITIDCGNILTHSEYSEWLESVPVNTKWRG